MKEPATAAERTMQAKLNAHLSWAHTANRTARTQPARDGWLRKLEQQVDPQGELLPEERTKRAESLRKAHMKRMALQSARVRRLRREAAAGGDA
jgi:hypothetical protein